VYERERVNERDSERKTLTHLKSLFPSLICLFASAISRSKTLRVASLATLGLGLELELVLGLVLGLELK
jgi:hypothetical protein